MTQRSVLLDHSFIDALLAVDSPANAGARRIYSSLIEGYRRGTDLLFALSTVLGQVPREFRRDALAPVAAIHVARQHRTAAKGVTGADSDDMALTLVLMRRERIYTVATASHGWDDVDVEVLDASSLDIGADEPDSFVSPRTESLPDRPPTAE